MGRAGPSRTPKDILKIRGSWRAETRGDEPKAEPAPKSLRCPSWLSDEAKRVWRQIVKQMGVMGVLTLADVNVVARYCDVWARWRKAHAFVMEKGEGYPLMRDGKVVGANRYPQTTVATQLLSELTKLEDRLGLSPGARAGLAIDNKGGLSNEPEEKARFFRAG